MPMSQIPVERLDGALSRIRTGVKMTEYQIEIFDLIKGEWRAWGEPFDSMTAAQIACINHLAVEQTRVVPVAGAQGE